MEPRQIWALLDGDARRWSRVTELVAWAVWLIVVAIPMSGHGNNGGNQFLIWLRRNTPPGFIIPRKGLPNVR
jgi:hypothetical protein